MESNFLANELISCKTGEHSSIVDTERAILSNLGRQPIYAGKGVGPSERWKGGGGLKGERHEPSTTPPLPLPPRVSGKRLPHIH